MFLKYYGDLLFYNVIFSVALGNFVIINGPLQLCAKTGITGFKANPANLNSALFNSALSFLVLGYLGSIYAYKQLHEKEYYFYYNAGLSKQKLLIYALCLNVILFLSLTALFYV
jgi:hypothetical protein